MVLASIDMARIESKRTIKAPREEVFDVTAHIENYADVIPAIVDVEFLSEERSGVGTRFKETRQMGRRKGSSTLEVTEYDRPNRIRLVSDQGGVRWDTTFSYLTTEAGTDLHMVMDIKPQSWFGRFTARTARGIVTKALEADLDAVATHFEPTTTSS